MCAVRQSCASAYANVATLRENATAAAADRASRPCAQTNRRWVSVRSDRHGNAAFSGVKMSSDGELRQAAKARHV